MLSSSTENSSSSIRMPKVGYGSSGILGGVVVSGLDCSIFIRSSGVSPAFRALIAPVAELQMAGHV